MKTWNVAVSATDTPGEDPVTIFEVKVPAETKRSAERAVGFAMQALFNAAKRGALIETSADDEPENA